MKCSNCGAELDVGAFFCTSCGTKISHITQAPMMNQPYTPMTGQPSYQQTNPYQQMNPVGMNPYGPYMQQPKPPRKPLSKGAKMGIICGAAGVVLLTIFLLVILPILTSNKLKGKYVDSDNSSNYVIFDDGTYIAYSDKEIIQAGTYTIDGGEVTVTDIDGYSQTITYNKKKNQLEEGGEALKCVDKKATLDYKLTETYLSDLQDQITEIAEKAAKDEKMYDQMYWGIYINADSLRKPSDGIEAELAKGLDYDNDPILRDFLESEYLYIYLEVTYSGNVEVTIYVY